MQGELSPLHRTMEKGMFWLPSWEADFLIIGSGIAGLVAAYRAKEYGSVLVMTKERAQGRDCRCY